MPYLCISIINLLEDVAMLDKSKFMLSIFGYQNISLSSIKYKC